MKTTLNLKTLHGEKTEGTTVVEGIQVTKISGAGSLLTLPKSYGRRRYQLKKKELQPRLKSRVGII